MFGEVGYDYGRAPSKEELVRNREQQIEKARERKREENFNYAKQKYKNATATYESAKQFRNSNLEKNKANVAIAELTMKDAAERQADAYAEMEKYKK